MPEQLGEALDEAMSRREAMEKAFDDLSGTDGEGGEGAEGTVSGVRSSEDSSTTEVVVKPKVGEVAKTEPIVDETKQPLKKLGKSGPDAKASGQVDKKGKLDPAAKAGEEDGKQKVAFKAPNTWKPAAREKFAESPPEVQEEIIRREGEITKALNDTAAARRWSQEFHGIVRPFEGLIKASGATPMQAVNNLMNTAATLQTGTQAQKVGIVADLIRLYGVNLQALDQVLAGTKKPGEAAPDDAILKAIDARLKPMQEFINTVQGSKQKSQQALLQESQQATTDFENDPANEFFSDLREDIADILDLAANRGREMTLKQAYDLAAKQHPEISKVIDQRANAEKVKKDAANLQRSRRAASSQPAGTPGGTGMQQGKPAGRRAAIEQAWDDHSA